MSATSKRDEMVQFEPQLLAVAGTFEYTPKPCTATPLSGIPTPKR